jgi:hypothetical protein
MKRTSKGDIIFRIALKPAKGFETVVSSFTYMTLLEQLKGVIGGLGLKYKISNGTHLVAQSEGWKE